MVEELASHEWCKNDLKNKFGQMPIDIICSRSKKEAEEKE